MQWWVWGSFCFQHCHQVSAHWGSCVKTEQFSAMRTEPFPPCKKQFCKSGLDTISLNYQWNINIKYFALILSSVNTAYLWFHKKFMQLFKPPKQIPHMPLAQMLQLGVVFCSSKPEIFCSSHLSSNITCRDFIANPGAIPRQTMSCMKDLQ